MPPDVIQSIADRHGFSREAVETAWNSLHRGGSMAQFSHPELGGHGQWMPGMLMIGDMFNNGLKARVDNLFHDLAAQPVEASTSRTPQPARSQHQSQGDGGVSLSYGSSADPGNWYPTELGYPSTTGSQNNVRYAYFPQTRRLAIELHGRVTIYDTADHQISGVAQGQTNTTGTLTFTSQFGLIPVSSLRVVE